MSIKILNKNILAVLVFSVFVLLALGSDDENEDPSSYPTSSASYEELNAEVGCGSKYSKDKKKDIFRSRYRNHWMTWYGEVVLAEADGASLNIDGFGTQDLSVDFSDKNAGYNLINGDNITVRFVMKRAGGCLLPFSGDFAVIVR